MAEDSPSTSDAFTAFGDLAVGPPDDPKLVITQESSAVMRFAGDGVPATTPNFDVGDGSPYLKVLAAPTGLLIHNVELIGKNKWRIYLYAWADSFIWPPVGDTRSGMQLTLTPPMSFSDKATLKVTTSYNGQFPNTLFISSPWPELAGLNITNIGNDLGYVHSGGGTATLAVRGVTPVSLALGATALSPQEKGFGLTQITVVVEYDDPEAP